MLLWLAFDAPLLRQLLLQQLPLIHRTAKMAVMSVGADLNLTHRADPILTRGWMPTV